MDINIVVLILTVAAIYRTRSLLIPLIVMGLLFLGLNVVEGNMTGVLTDAYTVWLYVLYGLVTFILIVHGRQVRA